MTDSQRVRQLIDKMESLEDRLIEVKKELAATLGVSQPPAASAPSPDAAPSSPKPKTANDTPNGGGAVRKGTRGHELLTVMYKLGGKARAAQIAEEMRNIGRKPTERTKRVRTYFYHLSRPKTAYLEKSGEHGLWQISQKGYAALGKQPILDNADPEND